MTNLLAIAVFQEHIQREKQHPIFYFIISSFQFYMPGCPALSFAWVKVFSICPFHTGYHIAFYQLCKNYVSLRISLSFFLLGWAGGEEDQNKFLSNWMEMQRIKAQNISMGIVQTVSDTRGLQFSILRSLQWRCKL